MAALVRTLGGDVEPGTLGVVDTHDHLFLRSAALAGQELDDVPAARRELASFAAAGGNSLVQWTPAGMGRRLDVLASAATTSGVAVVAATGRHRQAHYAPGHRVAAMGEDALADLFVRDVRERSCGVVKVATGRWGPSPFERTNLAAAAQAHRRTGAPVVVHLEGGTGALEVTGLLRDLGVRPAHLVLGHLGRFPDPHYLADVAATGAWCCFDLPSPHHHATDWRLPGAVAELAAAGHADRLLLGGDTTTPATRADGPLGARWASGTSRLRSAVVDDVVDAMIRVNPARALALARPDAP